MAKRFYPLMNFFLLGFHGSLVPNLRHGATGSTSTHIFALANMRADVDYKRRIRDTWQSQGVSNGFCQIVDV